MTTSRTALRSGYTTGACAAAAAKGAAEMLRDRCIVDRVEVVLPGGELAAFVLRNQHLGETSASCSVIKDAGDDPDVTNGAEIHVSLSFEPSQAKGRREIVISGGTGIGRVTKPGLAVPVGEWAINPVPRQMIRLVINETLAIRGVPSLIQVVVSIPSGEELAKKTLNARLGIIGGLSILGTTGIVKPISTKAWTDTIDAAIDVARACGSETLVLSTGRTSELVAERQLRPTAVPNEEAFIMMGDHAGYALKACTARGAQRIIIAGQFAKLVKIACGHEQTHVSSSELDLQHLERWLGEDRCTARLAPLARQANTARQVLEESDNDPTLISAVCDRVKTFAATLAPRAAIQVLLAGYGQEVLYFG